MAYKVLTFYQTLLLIWSFPLRISASAPSVKIVGGERCDPTAYPFVVHVHAVGVGHCGGNLVTFRWVLTAAHCVVLDNIQKNKTLIISGYDSGERHIQNITAELGVVHAKFNLTDIAEAATPELRYDIGLIMVTKAFKRSITCNLVTLPSPGFTKSCRTGTVVGNGLKTAMPRSSTEPLKCLKVHVVSPQICAKSWPGSVFDTSVICTMETVDNKSPCRGDSGGPLLCSGRNIIIGIASAVHGCGLANESISYVRVETYLNFIQGTMNSYSDVTNVTKADGISGVGRASRNMLHVVTHILYFLYLVTY